MNPPCLPTILCLAAATFGCGRADSPSASSSPSPSSSSSFSIPSDGAHSALQRTATNLQPVILVAQAQPEPAAAPPRFAFPSDATGKLLEEVLSPPRQLPLPPASPVDQPATWTQPTSEALAQAGVFPLVAADVPQSPKLLARDSGTSFRPLRAIDAPPVYLAAEPPLPARTWLPYGNLSVAARPDAESAPPLVLHARPADPPLTPSSDPSATAVLAESVKALPPSAAVPAPPLSIAIGDPLARLREVRPAQTPADLDPPASSLALPSRPLLPVEAPPAAAAK